MEILNEMPRLKDQLSVTFPNTCGPRDKNFSKHSVGSALGEGRREYDPKDSKQHIKHNSRTLAKGAMTWKFMGVSNKKALRLRDEQEGASNWARLQSGKWPELWACGLKTVTFTCCGGNRSTFQPRMCLGCWGMPKRHRESKAREACERLKAEIRPLVSLPTAKPLGWF